MPPVGSSTCLVCSMHRASADHPCLVAHNSLFKIPLSFCLLFFTICYHFLIQYLLCSALFLGYPSFTLTTCLLLIYLVGISLALTILPFPHP